MGNKQGRCKQGVSKIPTLFQFSQRETMATWHRTDIAVTDVYEVMETIGKGHMGLVYKVRRHAEDRGLHNSETRSRSRSESIDGRSRSKSLSRSLSLDGSSSDLQPSQIDFTSPKPKPILRKPSHGNLSKLVPTNDGESDIEVRKNSAQSESPASARKLENELDDTSQHSFSSRKKKNGRKSRLRFQRHYACKTIGTSHCTKAELHEMLNEIYIMRSLDHPYIIRLYEVYQVKKKIWMVMDLCTGGNLTTRKLQEQQVVVIAEQILRGVAYLHKNGVCHRDLKLENILYDHSGKDATIRLIDFGLSQKYESSEKVKRSPGAVYTLSPEICSGSGPYTEKSDVWAIGVIIWVLLAGDYPFMKKADDLKNSSKREALINADYDYGITWRGRGITSDAKRFVAGCLRKNPKSRWSSKMALNFVKETWVPVLEENKRKESEADTWESKNRKNTKSVVSHFATAQLEPKKKALHIDLDDIAHFCECGLFKKTILITMANTMDRSEVGDLQELFLLLDSDNTGTISLEELKEALRKLDLADVADERLKELFSGIDHDRSGQIHYAEFLAALAESHGLVTMDRLADAFDRIDSDGKGFITHNDLKAILGKNYNKNTVSKMIEEADFKKNGQIDYDELLQLMFGEDDESELEGDEEKAESREFDLDESLCI